MENKKRLRFVYLEVEHKEKLLLQLRGLPTQDIKYILRITMPTDTHTISTNDAHGYPASHEIIREPIEIWHNLWLFLYKPCLNLPFQAFGAYWVCYCLLAGNARLRPHGWSPHSFLLVPTMLIRSIDHDCQNQGITPVLSNKWSAR